MRKVFGYVGSIGCFVLVPVLAISAPGCSAPDAPAEGSDESDVSTATGQQLWSDSETNVFNGKVHRISLKMNRAVWDQLHNDEKANRCVKADNVKWWQVRDFVVDGQAFSNAAIKVKGNTSRCIPRVQFSVRLDRTKDVFSKSTNGSEAVLVKHADDAKAAIESRRFFGMSGFNLRRSFNDSSASNDGQQGLLAREPVATWAMAQAETVKRTSTRGAPVYRTAFTVVDFLFCANDADQACTGSGNFSRIYSIGEDIGADFFKQRYDDASPTAFSLALGCGLKLDAQGRHKWSASCLSPEFVEGKKFKADDPAMVATVASMFDGPDGLVTRVQQATSVSDVAAVLDVDSFLNYAAGATVTGHWDSALGNFNNDVLYFHKASGKWKIVTWDMDNSFDFDNDLGKPNRSYSYKDGAGRRAIFDKLFSLPGVDAMLRERVKSYVSALYIDRNSGPLQSRIQSVKSTVAQINQSVSQTERQNIALSKEMEDYARERYINLKTQIPEIK